VGDGHFDLTSRLDVSSLSYYVIMPRIEVIPHSNSVSAPGWAYVPDNGYDPSKVAIQPSGARKRAARASGAAVGDATNRQQNAVLKHLADLDKENHRDVQVAVPSKHKDTTSRGTRSP
jgi:zinc finger HIT domain-containing protein 1